MKKFIINSLILLIIVLSSMYVFMMLFDGRTDPYYIRFTTPKQHSLIVGTSRAAQGIVPQVINNDQELRNNSNIFNYAFTIYHSPYGPHYYNSIFRKLDESRLDSGIFIIAVDPWSISSSIKNPNDTTLFVENRLCVGVTKTVDRNPNIEYIYKNYQGPFYKLFFSKRKKKEYMFLHNDGWLECYTDTSKKEQYIERKIKMYQPKVLKKTFSQKRFEYLQKTIELFQQKKGKVYLVRIPIHQKMMDIENQLMPNFNDKIDSLALKYQISYLDMTYLNKEMIYTDGNHLYKDSGKEFTKILTEKIKEEQNKK